LLPGQTPTIGATAATLFLVTATLDEAFPGFGCNLGRNLAIVSS
jgi:hypothetical protein